MSPTMTLLDRLWEDYASLNPQAGAIHRLLTAEGERVVNDHIALRTFNDPRVNIDRLASAFTAMGYRAADSYEFPEKKLDARHYEHADATMPRVFISELRIEECSAGLRQRVSALLEELPPTLPASPDFPVSGRPWSLGFPDYRALADESEYAGWLAAFGFRANHFTVLVNALKKHPTLQSLNVFLKSKGFALNTSGGEIKGTPADLLEQSSTLADKVDVRFNDGSHTIPGCYYEFARRYPMPDGRLFGGFIARSADKIFESTNRR
ncbi:MAG: DUF1338 domain-containing protein [Planctomycetes bacterium]|nr:DUF1338 domain-containing protein [Planctomycetota bacterium]